MTDLRDARLKQALDHAPDAHMAPDSRTRAAIRAMAGQAAAGPVAAPMESRPWWRRLFGGSSSARMPWNAAFATVLLASLVTLIWRDEETPGARTGDQPMASAPPVVAPAPPPATTAATPPVAPAPAPAAPAPKPASGGQPPEAKTAQLAKKAEETRAPAQDKASLATQQSQREVQGPALAETAPARRDDERRRNEAAAPQMPPPPVAAAAAPAFAPAPAPAPVAPAQQPMPAAAAPSMADAPARASAAPMAPDAAAPVAPRPAPSVAPRALPASPPPAVTAPSMAQERDKSAPSAEGRYLPDRARSGEPGNSAGAGAVAGRSGVAALDTAAFDEWTQARITLEGRTSLVSRAQAESLAAQVRAMALAAVGSGPAAGPVRLQVELLRDSEVLGVLVVGEASARWTQRRPGFEHSFLGRANPLRVQDLLTEARRLANR